MGLGAPAKPFRPSSRNVQLGAVSNRTICRARHVVRLRTRRSLSESGRPASLKRVPTPLLSGSPGLATMLTVAGHCLPGSAFEPGSRGDAGTCSLVSARATVRSLTTLAFINSGIRQSFHPVLPCKHVGGFDHANRRVYYLCFGTPSADCDAAAGNAAGGVIVPSTGLDSKAAWQAKLESPEPIAWASISSNETQGERA